MSPQTYFACWLLAVKPSCSGRDRQLPHIPCARVADLLIGSEGLPALVTAHFPLANSCSRASPRQSPRLEVLTPDSEPPVVASYVKDPCKPTIVTTDDRSPPATPLLVPLGHPQHPRKPLIAHPREGTERGA